MRQHLLTALNTVFCSLVLSGFYLVGTFLAVNLPLPITGALYGMALLLFCLFTFNRFAHWMIKAVQPLLKHMVFFFIPAVMGVFTFSELITQNALALFCAVVVSTLVCLGITAVFANSQLKKKVSKGAEK